MAPRNSEQQPSQNATWWVEQVRGWGITIQKMYDVAAYQPVLAYAALRVMGKAGEVAPDQLTRLKRKKLVADAHLSAEERVEYKKNLKSITTAVKRSQAGYKGAVKRYYEPAFRSRYPEITEDSQKVVEELASAGAMCHLILAHIAEATEPKPEGKNPKEAIFARALQTLKPAAQPEAALAAEAAPEPLEAAEEQMQGGEARLPETALEVEGNESFEPADAVIETNPDLAELAVEEPTQDREISLWGGMEEMDSGGSAPPAAAVMEAGVEQPEDNEVNAPETTSSDGADESRHPAAESPQPERPTVWLLPAAVVIDEATQGRVEPTEPERLRLMGQRDTAVVTEPRVSAVTWVVAKEAPVVQMTTKEDEAPAAPMVFQETVSVRTTESPERLQPETPLVSPTRIEAEETKTTVLSMEPEQKQEPPLDNQRYEDLMDRVIRQEGGRPLTEEEWMRIKVYMASLGKIFEQPTDFYRWFMGDTEPNEEPKRTKPAKLSIKKRIQNWWLDIRREVAAKLKILEDRGIRGLFM